MDRDAQRGTPGVTVQSLRLIGALNRVLPVRNSIPDTTLHERETVTINQ